MVEPFGDLATKADIPVWLFLIDPGHLRLMSDEDLRSVLDVDGFQGLDAIALDTREERERLAGVRMRLFRTAITPFREQWRLKIPAEAFDACEERLDRNQVWIEQVMTTIDVYTATYVQKIRSKSPSELLALPKEERAAPDAQSEPLAKS
jgi:hypothetical protein